MNERFEKEYESKLEAFAACFFLMLIMLLLIVIGRVAEVLLDVPEAPAYAAIELKTNEEDQHDRFY